MDKEGNTVDFLLMEKRDEAAARQFFDQAIENNGTPRVINMDKRGANKAAMDSYTLDHKTSEDDTGIEIRQVKYLNNQIELVHMIRKGQMIGSENKSVAEQFYSLAA